MSLWKLCFGLMVTLALLPAAFAPAQAAGLLRPAHENLPPLKLEEHVVEVVIEDGYAVTTIEQVFANPNSQDLEAVYSFPVPEKAAVSNFTYWIDGKPITGEVVEKKRAREIYEQEKQAGREAGLTEQDDYKTFDISVWPVQAGKRTRIRLSYIQPAHVDTGIGRYVYPLEEGGVDEEKLAFWTTSSEVSRHFRFSLWLRSAVPVKAVRLPAHPGARVTREQDGSYRVVMESGGTAAPSAPPGEDVDLSAPPPSSVAAGSAEAQSGQFGQIPAQGNSGAAYNLDEDIVVYWRLEDGLPGSVDLVAHKPDPAGKGTFMMVVTPGDELAPVQQEGADWLFVLDKSGSMQVKIASLKEGVRRAFKELQPVDRVHVVAFDRTVTRLTNGPIPATPENLNRLLSEIEQLQAGESTNMFAGLEAGLAAADADRVSAVFLVTDGVANTGEVRHKAFVDLMRKKDVRLFTFIMGNSANRPLLESMTKVSGGTSFSVSNNDDVVGVLLSATSKVTHEALRDIRVRIDGVRTENVVPKQIGSLYRGQQLVLFGHYRGEGEAKVSIEGKISGAPRRYETRFRFPRTRTENPEIERLWTFAQIEDLMEEIHYFGEGDDRRQAVVDLAVAGGLVTPYTSMLVVRDERFKEYQIARKNAPRVAEERAAQTARSQRPVPQRRVGKAQPAFSKDRPRYADRSGGGGGGGAGNVGLIGLLISSLLGWFGLRARKTDS